VLPFVVTHFKLVRIIFNMHPELFEEASIYLPQRIHICLRKEDGVLIDVYTASNRGGPYGNKGLKLEVAIPFFFR
jgi:hypothetical protein